ncbi:MAG: RNB domain-containing ribonuclease, partial [Acidobacteria bacterium]|nr:RNB domain-containing ribonuclease [Acidobacteriota bacterium]
GVDRLAMTVRVDVDPEGRVVGEEAMESVIRVRGNVTYQQVLDAIEAGDDAQGFVSLRRLADRLDRHRGSLRSSHPGTGRSPLSLRVQSHHRDRRSRADRRRDRADWRDPVGSRPRTCSCLTPQRPDSGHLPSRCGRSSWKNDRSHLDEHRSDGGKLGMARNSRRLALVRGNRQPHHPLHGAAAAEVVRTHPAAEALTAPSLHPFQG